MSRGKLWLLVVVLWPSGSRAGGFELLGQTPAGVATVGAQAAAVEDASGVAYNPAALTFFQGLSFIGGGAAWHTNHDGDSTRASGTLGLPMVFLADRLGPYVGIGIGASSSFATQVAWPDDWPGAAMAQSFTLRTTTINPSVALRPFPRVSVGFGLDIVPATLALRHALPDGGVESQLTAVGFGGNVGVLVRIVPRWLDLGLTYRSAVDLDFDGSGLTTRSGIPNLAQDAKLTLPLPHNLTFAVASRPATGLTLSLDVHLTLWSDLSTLELQLTDRDAPAGAKPVSDARDLSLRDSVGVRLGCEHRLLNERLRVRLGIGFDTSPVKRGWLGPQVPDSNRVSVGVGFAYRLGAIGIDASYGIGIGLSRQSTDAALPITYMSLQHVVAVALVVHLKEFGLRVDIPDYRH